MLAPAKAILVLITLAFLSNALHLHNTQTNYVSYLESQQGTIKAKLNALSIKLSQDYKSVEQQNDINKKIALLENYLNQERLLLMEIYAETFDEQLNNSGWVCPIISNKNKEVIGADLDGIKQDLKDIEKVLKPLNDSDFGPGIDMAKEQLMGAVKTTQQSNNVMASIGTQVDPSTIHIDKKANLASQNWILDGKKVDQLNNQYKKASQTGSLKICPIDQPFFSSKQNQCISCNGDNQFFSMRTEQCTKCYNFDIKQHKCKDNEGATTNILPSTENRIIVPQGKSLDDYKIQSESGVPCPQNAPFYTGQECIQCELFFDIEAKTCKTCSGKYYYDTKTNTCKMEEVTVSNLEAGKALLIIPNDKNITDIINDYKKLEQENKLVICPSEKPFFNDFECISCSQGTLFSIFQKSCGTCEAGTYFNKLTNHCQFKRYYSNLDDPNWASKKTYPEIQKEIQQMQKDPLYQKCPVDTPFSTGKECIQCNKDEHFDIDKKKCDKCYNGQTFNKNLHKCSFPQNNFQTNPQKTSKLIFEGRPKNEWMYIYYQNIEKNQGMTDCPPQKPYFDGLSCIVCPEEHPYFNLEYKMCQKCPQETEYNKTHHECLTTEGNIATQVPTLEKMAAGIFS